MAQRTTPTAAKPEPTTGRPPGRPPGSKNKAKVRPAAKAAGGVTRTAPVKPGAPPRKAVAAIVVAKPSKEELWLQVEKLECTVATLRARSREAMHAAKQTAARIKELERQLQAKEKQASELLEKAPRGGKKPTLIGDVTTEAQVETPRRRRRLPKHDPGDAVPPGGAVQEPPPMHAETTAASESLKATVHPAESGEY